MLLICINGAVRSAGKILRPKRSKKRRNSVEPKKPRRSLERMRPLVHLDIGAPRIVDEQQLDAVRQRLDAAIERESIGLKLLRGRFDVRHIEADVVEDPPFGGNGG